MFRVHQHWDPLKVCAVGKSYGPEYYSWIKNSKTRQLFEKIALETEEDYQAIINKLKSFNVDIVRPEVSQSGNAYRLVPPPMNPRDNFVMIGSRFYTRLKTWEVFYQDIKDKSWPNVNNLGQLEDRIMQECLQSGWDELGIYDQFWQPVYEKIKKQGNSIVCCHDQNYVNGNTVLRVGSDLYFAADKMCLDENYVQKEFEQYRVHYLQTQGHGDGTYCAVCPGLIVSLKDIPSYKNTFPDWEIVYLSDPNWESNKAFQDLKKKNGGKWWIPGWEYDTDTINLIEAYLSKWVGYVEETVFDVNMFVIDKKNVLVLNENNLVFDALHRYGITPHLVPFRHKFFWDGGLHCITTDLDREGIKEDFFPSRHQQ